MLTKRIIACLDVHAGRVVKGVQFVDIVDAGDPGGTGGAACARRRGRDCAARYHGHARRTADAAGDGAAHGAGVVCAIHGGRRHSQRGRSGAGVRGGGGQDQHQLGGACRSHADQRDRAELWSAGGGGGDRCAARSEMPKIRCAMRRCLCRADASRRGGAWWSGRWRRRRAERERFCLRRWMRMGRARDSIAN